MAIGSNTRFFTFEHLLYINIKYTDTIAHKYTKATIIIDNEKKNYMNTRCCYYKMNIKT